MWESVIVRWCVSQMGGCDSEVVCKPGGRV
jgi:hypothetical protein